MRKTCHDGLATVNPGKYCILCVSAQRHRLLNYGSEILIFSDMYNFRVRYDFRGKHPISIAGFRRHQTVCCKKNRRREICKFFLLVLPRRTKVAFEMAVFFEFRIGVCRQHLTVSIDIDSLILRLLQKLLQIIEVVPGNDDEGSFFNCQRHLGRHRRTIGFGIRPIQKLHAA